MPRAASFHHEVAFYDGDDALPGDGGSVPASRGSRRVSRRWSRSARRRPSCCAASSGAEADELRFVEHRRGRPQPGAAHCPPGASSSTRSRRGRGFRGLGEPVWPGRDPAEIDECHRHEALLNQVFGDGAGGSRCSAPTTVAPCPTMCCRRRFAPTRTSPAAAAPGCPARPGTTTTSGPTRWPASSAPSRRRSRVSLRHRRPTRAARLRRPRRGRRRTLRRARRRPDPRRQRGRPPTASSTAAAGAAPTPGASEGALLFEGRDSGRIAEPLVGRVRPTPTQPKGRGLWMTNQLCDLVQIRSSAAGTAVRLRVALD